MNSDYDYKDDYLPLMEEALQNLLLFKKYYPNIAKFFLYRLTAKLRDIDCDSTKKVLESQLSLLKKGNDDFQNAEVKAIKGNQHKFEIINGEKTYRGETINSFWKTFKIFLQNHLKDELSLDSKKLHVPLDERHARDNQINWYLHFCLNCPKLLYLSHEKKKDLLSQFEIFAKLTHTMGNFMPCPPIFNQAKNASASDYLPLFVDYIQENISPDSTDLEKWHRFLVEQRERLCLEMYYSVKLKGKCAEIVGISFFHGQSTQKPLPKSMEELKQCLEKMNECIEKRTKKLVGA